MAQQRWYQKATVQVVLVTGSVMIIVALVQSLSGKKQLQDQIVSLTQQNSTKDAEVQRLQTMLVPFQTIALDRYPGDLNDALSKFANDLKGIQQTLDQSLRIIDSFEVEIAITVSADWESGVPPKNNSFLKMGSGSDTKLVLYKNSGEQVEVFLYGSESPNVVPVSEKSSTVTYRAVARAGEWPIGSDYRDIKGCREGSTVLYGINSSLVNSGVLDQVLLNITIFVNGIKQWVVSPKTGGPIDISNAEGGSTQIMFKGNFEFSHQKAEDA